MATGKTAATKAKMPAKRPAAKKAAARKKSAVKSASGTAPRAAGKKQKKDYKVKVVRDSFTMPQDEYKKIAEIKSICLKAKMHVKKSEVLRAGLKLLAKLDAAQLKGALNGLEKIKTGRPKKH
jgi:hypothetical protein